MDWENQGNRFTSFTMKNLSAMGRRIMGFMSHSSKWLHPTMFPNQSRLENEGQRFSWVDRLVGRLENTSRYSSRGFQRPGLESARPLSYRWFDPRYWMVSPRPEDFTDYGNANDMDAPEFIAQEVPQNIVMARPVRQAPAGIPRRFNRQDGNLMTGMENIPATEPMPAMQEGSPLPTTVVRVSSDRIAGPSGPSIVRAPAAMPHVAPATLENNEVQPAGSFHVQEEPLNNSPAEPQPVKHRGPLAAAIHKAMTRFMGTLDKSKAISSHSEPGAIQRRSDSINSFVERHSGSGFMPATVAMSQEPPAPGASYPMEDAVPLERHEDFSGQRFPLMEFSRPPEEAGFEESLHEDNASLPFYAPSRQSSDLFARESSADSYYQPASFALPVPAADAASPAFAQGFPAAMAAAANAGMTAPGNIGSGPVHLAMAPLLRPLPPELGGRREMPLLRENPFETETEEESTETEEQREPEYDPEVLATEVYAIIKRRILVEQERSRGSI
jgi:hypothetical protein